MDELKLKPYHTALFRKVGDGPFELVSITDPSKHIEPRIPLRRRFWLWLTGPYRSWRYRRKFENGIVIVRGDVDAGPYPPCSLPPGKRWTLISRRKQDGVDSR